MSRPPDLPRIELPVPFIDVHGNVLWLIPLPGGLFAMVDAEDYPRLARWKWCLSNGYARRGTTVGGCWRGHYLHHAVLDLPSGHQIDHVNGDRLDNRRSNLRVATRSQNCANTKKGVGRSSRYKGVCWDAQHGKWRARIRDRLLGLFDDESDAAYAYDRAARDTFGEYARVNFE